MSSHGLTETWEGDLGLRISGAQLNGPVSNFGERVDGGTLGSGQTASIGFWQNKNGQRLIESLNGSENSTLLAEYLAGTFSNMYGIIADANGDGITGDYMTNTKQSFVEVDFNTNTIDGSLVAEVESYGLVVTAGGVGSTFVNIGDNGEAFGVADDSDVQVIDLLLAVNERSTRSNRIKKRWETRGF